MNIDSPLSNPLANQFALHETFSLQMPRYATLLGVGSAQYIPSSFERLVQKNPAASNSQRAVSYDRSLECWLQIRLCDWLVKAGNAAVDHQRIYGI